MVSKTLTIQTPEGIVFPLLLADPVTRFLALVIDRLCVYLLSSVAGALLNFAGVINRDFAGAAVMIIVFVISLGYGIALEWLWQGQTVGKRIMRLRVMDEQGLRLTFSQIVIRNLLRFVDALPLFYLVGGVSSLISPRAQRIGDIAANTIVISHPRIAEPDLDQVLPGKFNSLRRHPNLAARLRQRISPREAGIVVQALARRDAISPDARVRLFGEVRRHMERLVTFPPETVEGLSDEQYIRNVVDILFR